MHVEGCPANVPEEDDTLMPRSLETIPSLASASAPSATVGLKMSSSPRSELEPLTERHCKELLDEVVLVVVDAPELPELPEFPEFDEFPEFEVEPEFPELPVEAEFVEQ